MSHGEAAPGGAPCTGMLGASAGVMDGGAARAPRWKADRGGGRQGSGQAPAKGPELRPPASGAPHLVAPKVALLILGCRDTVLHAFPQAAGGRPGGEGSLGAHTPLRAPPGQATVLPAPSAPQALQRPRPASLRPALLRADPVELGP